MSIRRKILLYFSVVTICLTGGLLFFIYTLFSEYREEEFQQRQKEKITSTLKFLTEFRQIDERLIEAMDRITIEDMYNEKLLIFDSDKRPVYTSIDDTPIPYPGKILDLLSPSRRWIEQKEALYDVVGIYLEDEIGRGYYGISKAYDVFGYTKLNYLKYVLIFSFAGITLVIIATSYYLSERISSPVIQIATQIKDFDFAEAPHPIEVDPGGKDEIALLAQRFNELLQRMNEAFAFQKHAAHHISHELKTPIAVLVSNLERIEQETDLDRIHKMLRHQKEDTRSLGEIINSLLEIAKMESGNELMREPLRIDELILDLASELNVLYPDFQFAVGYETAVEDESSLTVQANTRLLRAALINLMLNCIQYSDDQRARIRIGTGNGDIRVSFINTGPVLSEEELPYLFKHFFRGANSRGKRGFGLGLVFIDKILQHHGGSIRYSSEDGQLNVFSMQMPLS